MIDIEEFNNLKKALAKAPAYRVTAYRGYGDGAMRKQGNARMPASEIINAIITLDRGLDRKMGFGSGSLGIEENGSKITIAYTYDPAIALYKAVHQKMVLEF